MPVKIRLARHGRKARPIYHIVVADSRAPRDGKYIQKLGLYNPNTNPATIDLDFDRALDWLQKGAQPTDTCRAILSKKGVMMKKHLLDGARKGAFSEEEAEKRFDVWIKEKEAKLLSEIDKINQLKEKASKEAAERESKVNEERSALLAKKKAEIAAETAAANAPVEEEVGETVSEEVPASEEAKVVEEAPLKAEEKPTDEEEKPAKEDKIEE